MEGVTHKFHFRVFSVAMEVKGQKKYGFRQHSVYEIEYHCVDCGMEITEIEGYDQNQLPKGACCEECFFYCETCKRYFDRYGDHDSPTKHQCKYCFEDEKKAPPTIKQPCDE